MAKKTEKKKFSKKCQDYMFWLADPVNSGKPRTDYYRDLGSMSKTIWKWEQLPGFWDEVRSIRLQHMRRKSTDVVDSVFKGAIKGGAKQQEMYLEMTGDYVKKEEHKHSHDLSMSDEKKKKLLDDIKKLHEPVK